MLAPEFPPVWGGVGTYTFELVRHLPKNVEIHVLTPRREYFVGSQRAYIPEKDICEEFGQNVHIHYVSKANDSFFYNAMFQYGCLKNVPRLVKEERIDLIHSHTAHMPDLLLMLRKLDIPTITTVHTTIKSQRIGTKLSGSSSENLEKSEKATSYLYPFLRVAEKLYFSKKRSFITPSVWMRDWLTANFHISSNVTVIPNCVDPEDYCLKSRYVSIGDMLPKDLLNKRIVLYAGRMLALKGVDTLIQAIPKILKSVKSEDVLFVFSGSGINRGLLQRLQKIDKAHYLFTGPLPKEILIPLMMQSALVVLPSYHENCPYTVLESMACGTPVVASNVGGIPEIITDGVDGLLVEPGHPDMLAKTIVRLLSDTSLKNLLGQRAKSKIANKFSWQANISKYLKCYSEASTISS